ncbi:portal vertex of the head [Tenacibaculum phage pT24]|uniref:Portal vertex of the head n=1 Tax=Tenacibaculum phage pT24 TaxID=1880590 RepID=A0A1W7GKQ3_9CAUD|nr:portal vertex of the head [Tenacibaculum phage pT24]BAX25556.1 portal vertex of the head [Tenacibaculum phage pT24]
MTSYSKKDLHRKDKQGVQAKDFRIEDEEIYSTLIRHKKLLSERNKNKGFQNLEHERKTNYYDDIASKPEIKEVLTKLCNELIITSKEIPSFAEPKIHDDRLRQLGFKKEVLEKVKENLDLNFSDFVRKMGLSGDGAWQKMYQFLKYGRKAWFIIYDNPTNPKKIHHFVEVDVNTLEPYYERGQRFWIHRPKSTTDIQQNVMGASNFLNNYSGDGTVLFDHEIIYLSWSDDMEENETTSYLEGLIKPYNMMRVIDETKIIWAVTNSTYRTMYSIPTQTQGRNRSEQTVSMTMELYKDDYNFDSYSGDVSVNGTTNLPMSKDIFLSNGDSGTPEVTVLGGEGFDMQNMEPNEYMKNKFYSSTMMPFNRFEKGGQDTWNYDPTSVYIEEIGFDKFKRKIQNIYGKILLIPLTYQLILEYPYLHNEPDLAENIYLDFNSDSELSMMIRQELLKAKFDFISEITDKLTIDTPDGDTIPWMPIEYAMKEYAGFTEEEIKYIDKLRLESIEKKLLMERKIKQTRAKFGLEIEFDEFNEDPDNPDGGGGDDLNFGF